MSRLTIFLTGAAILALQLIASRVLAPFFGVSLYIWTGILSITLLCLALGYAGGGRLARQTSRQTLAFAFYLLPAIAGATVALSCAIYPLVLGPLARFDLLFGSFIACAILLAVPLIALSALNPILVALERRTAAGNVADAGSGQVFFVSTIGSVAGVLIAAFYFIPNWSNIESIAQIAVLLGGLAIAGSIASKEIAPYRRTWIRVVAGATIVVAAIILFTWKGGGVGRSVVFGDGLTYSLVANSPSPFGTIKIVDAEGTSDPIRLMFNDGISQNSMYRADGRSASLFTHILDIVGSHLRPDPQRALVLGLGAGFVPMSLAKRGVPVDVVEINPKMADIATRYFGYEKAPNPSLIIADARTFVHSCARKYDLIFVDLFFGDGTPEHLMTREFFRDIRQCLADSGVVAINSLFSLQSPQFYGSFLATLADTFDGLAFMQAPGDGTTNGFVFAARSRRVLEPLRDLRVDPKLLPTGLQSRVAATLRTVGFVMRNSSYLDRPIFTDANGYLSVLAVPTQRSFRHSIVAQIPDVLLID